MKKIGKNFDKNNKQELWLRLINAETEDELDMLQQTGVKSIQDAVVVLHKIVQTKRQENLPKCVKRHCILRQPKNPLQ